MAKQNVSNEFTIYPWMVSELRLSGNDLLVYALIYNDCENNDGKCTLSIASMRTRINVAKQTICSATRNLKARGLINKHVMGVINRKYYTINNSHERQ